MNRLAVLLGFLAMLGSIFLSAFQGQQIATIGVGLILIGIFGELRRQGELSVAALKVLINLLNDLSQKQIAPEKLPVEAE